jgi:hypothetical protein
LVEGPRFDDAVLDVALAAGLRRAGAAFLAALFSFPARAGLAGCFRRAFPFGVRAAAVFRRAPLLALATRAFLLEEVFLSPFFVPVFFAIAVPVSACRAKRQRRSAG